MQQKENIRIRKVDTDEYLQMVIGLLNEGHEVPVYITGSSMAPFLCHERDQIMVRKPEFPLKKGDMAFFRREDGRYIMHRIVRVGKVRRQPQSERNAGASQHLYYFVGDAQTQIEGPIDEGQIFGQIIAVCRKGKWFGPEDFCWKFFQKFWLHIIPLRPMAVKIYSIIWRIRHHGTE